MMTQLKHLLLTALLATAISSVATAQPPAPKNSAAGKAPPLSYNFLIQSNVPYAEVAGKPLLLDVVRPKRPAAGPLPAVVFIHGGGWSAGSKAAGLPGLALLAASGNYVGFSVDYRLTSEAIWPAQIYDCKAAIRWVRANAEKYGVNPDKIGVWGGSAGGHLVSLLGTSGGVKDLEGNVGCTGQSSRVTCVVDFCGPADFLAYAQFKRHEWLPSPALPQSPESRLFGGPVEQKRQAAIAASPLTYVSPDDPPFLIVHGTKDNLVPLEQSELLEAALRKAGVDVRLVKVEGGGHVFGGPEVGKRVAAFFARHLRGQKVEVSSDPIQASPKP